MEVFTLQGRQPKFPVVQHQTECMNLSPAWEDGLQVLHQPFSETDKLHHPFRMQNESGKNDSQAYLPEYYRREPRVPNQSDGSHGQEPK